MANIFNRLFNRSSGNLTEDQIRNIFNEAFFQSTGVGYTNMQDKPKSYIEEGYNVNPLVFGAINEMSTKTSSIPFYIKEIEDKNAKAELDNLNLSTKGNLSPQQYVKRLNLEKKAFKDDFIPFPLDAPNSNQSWVEFLALYKTFIKTTGNVYMYMVAPEMGMNKGEPKAIYILPSHLIRIVIKDNVKLLVEDSPIQGYILSTGKSYIEFSAEEVIHVKYSNPNYGENGEHLYGMSPLRASIKNIMSSNSALELNVKTLKSGGVFGFFYGKNNVALTKEQADAFKERLVEMNNSPEDLSKIAGMSVEMGFQRMSLTSDELKPFDFLAFDEKMIAHVLNWPLDDGDRGDFGGTINEIRKQRITDNIQPDNKLLTQAFNKYFLPRFKTHQNTIMEFDYTELPEMQSDIKELSEWLGKALDRGVISRNEYRLAIRYTVSEDADLDVFTVQNDIMSLRESLDNSFGVIE